jgi:YD repeat-containing protein
MVRPLESTAETQPQLKPALLRLFGDDFPVLHGLAFTGVRPDYPLLFPPLFSHRLARRFAGCQTRVLGGQQRNRIRNVFSRSHRAVIRVYDDAGNVTETHDQTGRVSKAVNSAS